MQRVREEQVKSAQAEEARSNLQVLLEWAQQQLAARSTKLAKQKGRARADLPPLSLQGAGRKG
eukprot:4901945-Pleurochrysis_carterae.AAC.4